ncbi:hypothetical protein CEH01_05505 [Streptococcus pyogenes]|nr:hypothetical protein CEH01_05505 [Streptococcus pyogenes]
MNIIHRMENGIDAVGDLTTYAVPCCPECKNEVYLPQKRADSRNILQKNRNVTQKCMELSSF